MRCAYPAELKERHFRFEGPRLDSFAVMRTQNQVLDSEPIRADISIAIVSFNNSQKIEATLGSILQCLPATLLVHVVVVDNHSTDDTVERVQTYAQKTGHVTLIQNFKNVGFGKAHNQVLDIVESRYHVICNPDIIISHDVFSPLKLFLERSPRIAIACPRFQGKDGTLQPLNRRYPTVIDLFLRRFLPPPLRPIVRDRLRAYDMQDVGYDHSYDVPFLSGAFMFCRMEALKAVGGFDERYFLYFEDADLSRKVQQRGYRTVYFPEVCVTHDWERMAHKSWRGAWVFAKSAYRYFRKWGFQWC